MEKPQLLRDFGLVVGQMDPGYQNHISDVPGVSVGHVTLHCTVDGNLSPDVCTGVTAIVPHQGDWYMEKCVAAAEIINGFGKTTGLVQLEELGQLESPILLTNTFGVPAATQGALAHMLRNNEGIGDELGSLNVVVGECNDSYLNDMRGMHVTPSHTMKAIEQAIRQTSLEQGVVGGGTGMRCFGWKGGIGSSSRRLAVNDQTYHIGVLVQSNFGRSDDLTILGAPVGRYFSPQFEEAEDHEKAQDEDGLTRPTDGSIMMIVATDLPLDSLQLKRLSRRCVVGLNRTGSFIHNGSGDVVIAFSNGTRYRHTEALGAEPLAILHLSPSTMSQAFRAVAEATEEAVLNSLFAATTTCGRNHRSVPALPRNEVAAFVREWISRS